MPRSERATRQAEGCNDRRQPGPWRIEIIACRPGPPGFRVDPIATSMSRIMSQCRPAYRHHSNDTPGNDRNADQMPRTPKSAAGLRPRGPEKARMELPESKFASATSCLHRRRRPGTPEARIWWCRANSASAGGQEAAPEPLGIGTGGHHSRSQSSLEGNHAENRRQLAINWVSASIIPIMTEMQAAIKNRPLFPATHTCAATHQSRDRCIHIDTPEKHCILPATQSPIFTTDRLGHEYFHPLTLCHLLRSQSHIPKALLTPLRPYGPLSAGGTGLFPNALARALHLFFSRTTRVRNARAC